MGETRRPALETIESLEIKYDFQLILVAVLTWLPFVIQFIVFHGSFSSSPSKRACNFHWFSVLMSAFTGISIIIGLIVSVLRLEKITEQLDGIQMKFTDRAKVVGSGVGAVCIAFLGVNLCGAWIIPCAKV